MEFDELSRKVIGCALEVHRNLGPSLWSQHIVNAWRVNPSGANSYVHATVENSVGLMINFNVTKLQNGIQRFVL